MTVDILILMVLGTILMSMRRIYSGIKNGAFYGKGNKNARPEIEPYITNIHRAETPAWYTQFGGMWMFVYAIARLIISTSAPGIWPVFQQLISTTLITMGASALASNRFQIWINRGAGLPDNDVQENKKSEFAFGKISIWWNTWWVGRFRKYLPYLAAIEIIVGIALLYM